MTRALGLSAFVLMLASPFIDWVNFALAGMALAVACIVWGFSPARDRLRAQEIDEARRQHELEGLIRDLNGECK